MNSPDAARETSKLGVRCHTPSSVPSSCEASCYPEKQPAPNPALPADGECGCTAPPAPEVGGLAFPCPLGQGTRGQEAWLVRITEQLIISAPSVPVPPWSLSTQQSTPSNFLLDGYSISAVFNFFPLLGPGCTENRFLAELSECPVKPLVTAFLLQEVPLSPSQVTRGGKETFTMM